MPPVFGWGQFYSLSWLQRLFFWLALTVDWLIPRFEYFFLLLLDLIFVYISADIWTIGCLIGQGWVPWASRGFPSLPYIHLDLWELCPFWAISATVYCCRFVRWFLACRYNCHHQDCLLWLLRGAPESLPPLRPYSEEIVEQLHWERDFNCWCIFSYNREASAEIPSVHFANCWPLKCSSVQRLVFPPAIACLWSASRGGTPWQFSALRHLFAHQRMKPCCSISSRAWIWILQLLKWCSTLRTFPAATILCQLFLTVEALSGG